MKMTTSLIGKLSAAALTIVASLTVAQATSFPQAILSVDGVFHYSTNETTANYAVNGSLTPVDTSPNSMKMFSAYFTGRNLIALLNASPAAAAVLQDVTGTITIPAGSYLVYDTSFGHNGVSVVGRNGYNFPLAGFDNVTHTSYSFLDLATADNVMFPAAYNVVTGTNRPASSEFDHATAALTFNDGNGTAFSLPGSVYINWVAPQANTNGTQKVYVSFNFSGSGEATYHNNISTVDGEANGAGSGTENVADQLFPFWRWWQIQYYNANAVPVNT